MARLTKKYLLQQGCKREGNKFTLYFSDLRLTFQYKYCFSLYPTLRFKWVEEDQERSWKNGKEIKTQKEFQTILKRTGR